jgi:hypothetical protein
MKTKLVNKNLDNLRRCILGKKRSGKVKIVVSDRVRQTRALPNKVNKEIW